MKAVNLLPTEMRGSAGKSGVTSASAAPVPPAAGGAGPFVVLGVLAIGVVAMAAYILVGNTVKDRESQLARVNADKTAMVARASALKPYADFQALAQTRVATVQSLATSRFDWEQALRDMSRALPSDVHLTSLEGAVGGAAAPGGVASAPTITMQGCTKTHTDVARLMSRLRNVRGVTRVGLVSSDKSGAGAVTPATQPADTVGGRSAQLCPKGKPPTFNMTVHFERSKALAASAAGAAAPTGSVATTPGTAANAAGTSPGTAAPANGQPAAPQTSGAAGTSANTPATQGGTP